MIRDLVILIVALVLFLVLLFCPTVILTEENPLDVCEVCGSLWRRQEITEVDPVTFLPIRTEMAMVRL